jgi:uncharacterized repeat protein (TIGR03803 family)
VIFDAAGSMYGTTSGGGDYRCGVVFKLTPAAGGDWRETVLHTFTGPLTDGCTPDTALTFDAAGNLYGTTSLGGTQRYGTVFELSPGANGQWTEKILYNFNIAEPANQFGNSGVTLDDAGNLYGASGLSNPKELGTIYELIPQSDGSWRWTRLYTFYPTGSSGMCPCSTPILDAAGNLYSTAFNGGPNSFGTAFKLTPTASGPWTLTLLYAFSGIGPSGHPPSGVILDGAGNLYGTTVSGGEYNDGTAFEITP